MRCLPARNGRPGDPHHGNFRWMFEDKAVEDLNAVQFVLKDLIPMMLAHGDRLDAETREAVFACIRMGIDEILRLDVAPGYTNIAVLTALNLCLGGELLDDAALATDGRARLDAWDRLTASQGAPFEFNSPTYTRVVINALKLLADTTEDNDTRILARTASARLALSVALRLASGHGPVVRSAQPRLPSDRGMRSAARGADVSPLDWRRRRSRVDRTGVECAAAVAGDRDGLLGLGYGVDHVSRAVFRVGRCDAGVLRAIRRFHDPL